MKNMLSKLFGPNWRSSTSGIVTVVAVCTAFAIHGEAPKPLVISGHIKRKF